METGAVDVKLSDLAGMAGGWLGPFSASGHALHYVPHPHMPPLQVAFRSMPQVIQPPLSSGQNNIRDRQRGVHRIAPGGTIVSREGFTEFFLRIDQGDRGCPLSWYRPMYPHQYRDNVPAAPGTATYAVTQPLRAVEPASDYLTLLSGTADVFPRDVRPDLPQELQLPALVGSGDNQTDLLELYNDGVNIWFQAPDKIVPAAVLARYGRLMLDIKMTALGQPAVPFLGNAELPLFSFRMSSFDMDDWIFQMGSWGGASYTRARLNMGNPLAWCAANDYAGPGSNSIITPRANPNGVLNTTRWQIEARWVLDMGVPEPREVMYAAGNSINSAGLGGQWWMALPSGIRNRRVGIITDNAPAGSNWWVQRGSWMSLGWGFGDALYNRAVSLVDYDSVDIGPAANEDSGVAIGMTNGGAAGSSLWVAVGSPT